MRFAPSVLPTGGMRLDAIELWSFVVHFLLHKRGMVDTLRP